jgi:thioredoxin-like negative regulator of GroEL
MSEITLETIKAYPGRTCLAISSKHCIPCSQMALFDEEIAKAEGVRFIKIDAGLPIVARLGVRGIPSYLLFMEGQLIRRISGFTPKEKFREFLS